MEGCGGDGIAKVAIMQIVAKGWGEEGGVGFGSFWPGLAQVPADTILEILNGWWCCDTEYV